jgi:hypothetical protein
MDLRDWVWYAYTFNPSPREVEAGRSKFEESMFYIEKQN